MYVAAQLKQFSKRFSVSCMFSHLDVDQFVRLHEQLLGRLTRTETQAVRSAHIVDAVEKSNSDELGAIMTKEKDNSTRRLILHYKHEKALRYFKRDFHQLWEKTFHRSSAEDIRVIVGTLINRSLSSLLVRKCPPLSMLRWNEDKKHK
jgi:hypothetical protein